MTQPSDFLMAADRLVFSYRHGGRPVLDDVSIRLGRGELVGVVGPNGVGKSTILKVLSGYLQPQRGEVLLEDIPVRELSNQERARRLAIIPQNVYAPAPFTVEQVVRMGRRARLSRFGRLSDADHRVIEETVAEFELRELAGRPVSELSGGERQRTMIAAAVAQAPEVLLLDEPTSHLDIGNSARVIRALLRWQRARGAALLVVTHDVQMAARICDRIVLLCEGRVLAEGKPSEVLNGDVLHRVYGSGVKMYESPWDGMPVILPDFRENEASASETAATR